MIYRLIAPEWLRQPDLPKVVEGEFSQEQIDEYNEIGYNIYYLPNYPSEYKPGITVDGSHIDKFEYVFVDMDLKDQKYADKYEFVGKLGDLGLLPSKVIDSGRGVHAYWRISDLDAMSYLRLQRRLTRRLNTDPMVSKIFQLMRVPGTMNTKDKDDFRPCELWSDSDVVYTCEQVSAKLPPITQEDETYCNDHYNKTYKVDDVYSKVNDELPLKWCKLLESNQEVKQIWISDHDDRSGQDFRLGHLLFANDFSKDEAMSVLVNAPKALSRTPVHRIGYAKGIVDKIWTYEITKQRESLNLSKSVMDILSKSGGVLKGTPFRCWNYIDATDHGFRLGQVIGLVAGSGVGKTTMALNMFMGFVKTNPDYVHFFIPLEQPENEIADRWRTMCGDNQGMHDKVHVMSNYDEDGKFRHLSFSEIKAYLLKFQKLTGKKIGCVVIDHIGALKKQGQLGENQDLMSICHEMKGFAVETNTLLIMQSQSNREKAGIGDLELSKDAAYGSVFFESYCDYLVVIFQPVKRCYSNPKCPTVLSFKFCKVRHKNVLKDHIKEDVIYNLFFDPSTEMLREMTQQEEVSFDYFLKEAVNKRKQDRKTDIISYQSINWVK